MIRPQRDALSTTTVSDTISPPTLAKRLTRPRIADEAVFVDVTTSPVSCQPRGGATMPNGLVGTRIAAHHVGAAHEELLAAVADAGHRFDAPLHAGTQWPTVPRRLVAGMVDRDHRRGFGGAVAFQQLDVEAPEELARFVAHPLGAADHERRADSSSPSAAARVLRTNVSVAKKDGRAVSLIVSDDLLRLARRGIEHRFGAGRAAASPRRSARSSGTSAAGRRTPVGIERHVRVRLLDIGDDVGVGEHHALGRALGARGEQDDRGCRGRRLARTRAAHEPDSAIDLVAEVDVLRTSSR